MYLSFAIHLFNEEDICQRLGVVYLMSKVCYEELIHFLFVGLLVLRGKTLLLLVHGLVQWVDI